MKVFIHGHAIDRASQRLLAQWAVEAPTKEPGLHSWLLIRAEAALNTVREGKLVVGHLSVTYRGVDFKFEIKQGRDREIKAHLLTLYFRSVKRPPERRDGRAPRTCRLCNEPECDCPSLG